MTDRIGDIDTSLIALPQKLASQLGARSVHGEGLYPLRTGAPPPLAPGFQDRPENNVMRAQWTSDPELRVVLAGGPGVGKSQLAAHLHATSDADVIPWVAASTVDELIASYAAAGAALRLGDMTTAEPTAVAFHTWLRGPGSVRTSLIILDDLAIDPVTMADWWP